MTQHSPIAGYEDWPAHARAARTWRDPDAGESDGGRAALAAVLGIPARPEATDVRIERSTVDRGIRTTVLTWWVGFGPRTTAYLVEPDQQHGARVPGILGLHAHGGRRWIGGEQLVDLGAMASSEARRAHAGAYDGLAPADALARRGYAVLAHDAFSWGSRRFDLRRPTQKLEAQLAAFDALAAETGVASSEIERFNRASALHEETLAKVAGVLGQSFAGLVLFDDLIATDVLASLPSVDSSRLGAFGFSGGGGRSMLLAALDSRICSHVVTCMMATFESLMPNYIDVHSWLLHSPGLWNLTEWPAISEIGSPRSLLVQYGRDDPLFPADGMDAAHRALEAAHRGTADYRGVFYDAGHVFNRTMQADAWDFFDATLEHPLPVRS
jgi:dienelactone hydrolase